MSEQAFAECRKYVVSALKSSHRAGGAWGLPETEAGEIFLYAVQSSVCTGTGALEMKCCLSHPQSPEPSQFFH